MTAKKVKLLGRKPKVDDDMIIRLIMSAESPEEVARAEKVSKSLVYFYRRVASLTRRLVKEGRL